MNYKNDFKQHLLIDLHELLIPVVDVGGFLISGLILLFFNWIVFVMISPFKNLHVNISFFHIKNNRWEQREREGGCENYLFEDIHRDIGERDGPLIIDNI